MSWSAVCALDDVPPDLGVGAWVSDRQIALFRLGERVLAIDNQDPASGANVLSRGLTGDIKGEWVVASPLFKHHYSLTTGRCLEDPDRSVSVYPTRVIGGRIWVNATLTGIELYHPGQHPPHPRDDRRCGSDGRDETLVLRDPRSGIYRRLVLRENRMRSAVLYGDARHGQWYFELMDAGRDVAALRDCLLFGPPESAQPEAAQIG